MQVLSYHEAWHLRQASKRELMFKTMVAGSSISPRQILRSNVRLKNLKSAKLDKKG